MLFTRARIGTVCKNGLRLEFVRVKWVVDFLGYSTGFLNYYWMHHLKPFTQRRLQVLGHRREQAIVLLKLNLVILTNKVLMNQENVCSQSSEIFFAPSGNVFFYCFSCTKKGGTELTKEIELFKEVTSVSDLQQSVFDLHICFRTLLGFFLKIWVVFR